MLRQLSPRLIEPLRVGGDTPNGLFLPYKPVGTQALTVQWDGQVYILTLNGDFPFRYFSPSAGALFRGALIRSAEFRVDLDSMYDAVREFDPIGAITLENGGLCIAAAPAGRGVSDPVDVPLWGEFQTGSSAEKIGFTRWRVVVRDNEEVVTLFEHDAKNAQ